MAENNQKIAKIFNDIAGLLEIKGESPFKTRAYRKAALFLENLADDIGAIYKKDDLKGLEKLPAIGKSMALKIEQYLQSADGTALFFHLWKPQIEPTALICILHGLGEHSGR
ncbi:MAG: DNA polymerase III, partial [Patescibacteria group bacterium]